MLLKEIRFSEPSVLGSPNHPRLASIITELAAFTNIEVEVTGGPEEDDLFEVYVYDLGQKFVLREFAADPEAVAKNQKKAESLRPRYMKGDECGGYEFPLVRGLSSEDAKLLNGVFVVRKGNEIGQSWLALRLEPPTGRALLEAFLLFAQEDRGQEDRERAWDRERQGQQQDALRTKLLLEIQSCGCPAACVHGLADCSSCEYAGGHAMNCPQHPDFGRWVLPSCSEACGRTPPAVADCYTCSRLSVCPDCVEEFHAGHNISLSYPNTGSGALKG